LNPKTTYSEQELVARLQQRNAQAFSYLYDNYSGALFGVVQAIISDKEVAADVLQNVFVNIWRRIESYDASKGRLFTWMMNIARNAAIDELRSKSHRDGKRTIPLPESEAFAGLESGPGLEDAGLKKMIGKLKTEWKVLIDLFYFQGYTHEEISALLGIPLGTVKTRIRSALIQLRTMIN